MVSRTVTTAWCTELGTTLPNGFTNNTTDNPAYFRCLNSFSVHHPARLRQFLFHWSRDAGAPLLRNSSGVLQWDELKAESVGFGAEFVFLALQVSALVSGKTRIIEFLPSGHQVEDDARQFVGGRKHIILQVIDRSGTGGKPQRRLSLPCRNPFSSQPTN